MEKIFRTFSVHQSQKIQKQMRLLNVKKQDMRNPKFNISTFKK